MMTVCGVCGKRIVVTWPEFWVYKTGKGDDTTYYCSENCLVVADTREMKDRIGWVDPAAELTEEEIETVISGRPVGFRRLKRTVHREVPKETPAKPAGQEREDRTMAKNASSHKLTREEKERAVELAISGGDPIAYLKELGMKNPWASWAYIKQTLRKAKPELYAQLPSDESRLDEEVSYGAQAAPAADPPVPADDPEAADPLEGFTAIDPGAGKKPIKGNEKEFIERLADMADMVSSAMEPGAPEGERTEPLVIKADDIKAALDPAVARMESMAAVEKTDKVPDVDAGERLLDDLPCLITGLKVNEFVFNLNRAGMVLILPESDRNFLQLQVTLTPDQWRRLVEVVPKVMKIFGMD